MASWKKVIVSGSDISQLNNDANYLLTGDTLGAAGLSGSFSGSFQGDGSNLTGVVGSISNALEDGNGIANFSYDGSTSGVTVAVEVSGSSLEVGTGGVRVADGGVGTAQLATNAVTNVKITNGTIANNKLVNDSVTVGTTEIDLGASSTTLAGLTSVTSTNFVGDLTGTATTASYVAAASIDGTVANATSASHAVIADGVQVNSVALGTDTTGNYVQSVANATNGGVTVTNGAAEGGDATVALNIDNLSAASVDVGADSIAIHSSGNGTRKESVADLVSGIAGDGLTATSGQIAVTGGSGSFSGSFQGDGSGLTGVTGTISNALTDGAGILNFSYDGSVAGVTIDVDSGSLAGDGLTTSGGAFDVQADGSTLSVGGSGVKVAAAGITATELNTSVAGTGLSGGGGTALSVDYGTSAGNAAQGNVTLTVNGTSNEIEVTGGAAAAIGANRSITVGLPNDVTISGDLTVLGTASFAEETNLAIADRFILLASGSTTAGDGGIVVQQTTQDVGEVFAYDNAQTRWGIGVDFSASLSAYTPDAFMAAAVNNAGNDPNGANDPGSRYNKKGNLYVASDSEDIWIYS